MAPRWAACCLAWVRATRTARAARSKRVSALPGAECAAGADFELVSENGLEHARRVCASACARQCVCVCVSSLHSGARALRAAERRQHELRSAARTNQPMCAGEGKATLNFGKSRPAPAPPAPSAPALPPPPHGHAHTSARGPAPVSAVSAFPPSLCTLAPGPCAPAQPCVRTQTRYSIR